ncbi:DNA replication and repair protein RecF [Flavihumibacter rivuli]|uniref:DNA replication/repair protein RecF n=1 Tax=Flavihumibacter rivuli TaxID=2838156 RepID=UPI001BDEDE8D|nr:DNA replication and repair protein RecF [Flavihumibacter rivuli]ULQ57630.1 DNA replication and repair protein RecF [Flavihumibacter rivuli]
MLAVEKIALFQFKNYLAQSFHFSDRVVGISGKNGIGKTNLLDAVYYLCFTKSYFSKSDAQHVFQGAQGFRIEGQFSKQGTTHNIVAVLRENGKKEFIIDGQPCERMADHIGEFPAVFIAPDDVQIITDGSEERRRFMDALFSQLDHEYLLQLMQYNKVLVQRNSLLKQMAETRQRNTDLLDVLDHQLISPANYIYTCRKNLLGQLLRQVKANYATIAGEEYDLVLKYESQLHELSMADWLARNRERDMYAQRTHCGVHRDDIAIQLNEKPFRQTASQGQRKSLLFALKLAEFSSLKSNKGFEPILLLDDVFEKLDAQRMHNLLHEVGVNNHGQVLVTDTHEERLAGTFSSLGLPFQSIKLS